MSSNAENNNAPNDPGLELRMALLEQSNKHLSDKVEKLETNNSKIVWIVVSAVVLSGLNIIMGGNPLP